MDKRHLRKLLKQFKVIGLFSICLYPNVLLAENKNEIAPIKRTEEIIPLFLETIVNHKHLNSIAIYYYEGLTDNLYASEDSILSWGITKLPKNLTSKKINGSTYYLVSDMKNIKYKVNQRSLSLDLSIPPTYFSKRSLEFGSKDFILGSDGIQTYGAFLNYNTYTLYGNNHDYNNNAYTTLGLFTPYGTISQSFLIQPENANKVISKNQEQLVWLNTQWRFDSKENLMTYILGDSTTSAQSWSGSAAFFGLNVYKNYGINPNIITFPQPNIIGNAALPSTVELSVNNVPITKQELNSGAFEFNNVPVLTGTGTIAVQSTNILGETTVTYVPYFTSPLLLAEGLDNFSIEAGLLRNNFGTKSFDYGSGLVVGTYSKGITDNWTSSVHGEFLREQQSAGAIQALAIGSGDGGFAIAGSHKDGGKYGALTSLSYQYSLGINIGGSISVASADFTNIGLINTSIRSPIYTAQAFVSYVLTNNNRLSFNYFRSKLRPSENDTNLMTDEINVGYDVTLFKRLNLSINALASLKDGKDWQVLASLQYIFDDDRHNIGLDSSYQDGQEKYGASLQGSTTNQKHGIDYNLAVTSQSKSQVNNTISGNMVWKNQYGDFSTLASGSSKQKNIAVKLAGGIVFINNGLYFTEPVRTSVVLVETPELPFTKIYYNNQSAGLTDKKGKLLIPNLSPFNNNNLAISPISIPLDTTIQSTALNIVPGYLTASYVPFKIKKIKSTIIELVNKDKKPLNMGSKAIIKELGDNNQYLVGYGGILYITDISPDVTELAGKVYQGWLVCEFKVKLPSGYENSVHERTLCVPIKK